MLYTASFYDPADWVGRAYRVSRAHPRGRRAEWGVLPFLYPPRDLLAAYRQGQLDFDALSRAYRQSLDASLARDGEFQAWLRDLPALGDVTLLCFERGDTPCHRRVAAHWLGEQEPSLRLGHLR